MSQMDYNYETLLQLLCPFWSLNNPDLICTNIIYFILQKEECHTDTELVVDKYKILKKTNSAQYILALAIYHAIFVIF